MRVGIPDKTGMRIGAIILAGGRGTRMGQPKDSLPFAGEPLLRRAIRNLQPACSPVVVVARDAQQVLPDLPEGVARTHDLPGHRGPLAALAAGLDWLAADGGLGAADAAFAAACDQPFVDAAFVRWLAAKLAAHDVAMPFAAGLRQPLCALYRIGVRAAAHRLLANGTTTPRSLADAVTTVLVDEAELRTFDPELACLVNVNTPEQLAAATARLGR